ncbi:hypothetical protein XENOCAPTIV_002519 [Xenoophorus captivus]|uniref:Uncharacterized protein n=1 Tax=Xenoophorus captivus TaxID=1517983 RepID=A0ABV0R4L5_9TELE
MTELLTLSLRLSHPMKEAHLSHLNPASDSFSYDPYLNVLGDGMEHRKTRKLRALLFGSALSSHWGGYHTGNTDQHPKGSNPPFLVENIPSEVGCHPGCFTLSWQLQQGIHGFILRRILLCTMTSRGS